MRHSKNEVFIHFVWATWDRLPLLTPPIRQRVYAAITAKCEELHCHVEAIGGVEDHVHLVVHMASTISAAALMKEVKGASSHLINHTTGENFFKWQGAYGSFSVSPEKLDQVIHYVQNQAEHHRNHILQPHWENVDPSDQPPNG